MTDDSPANEPRAPRQPASSNGRSAEGAASVRSGLARRRNPVLVTLGDFAQGTRRFVLRDPLSLFLLIASIGLAIAFAVLLGDIKPSSRGRPVAISTVERLARQRQIANAVLLDHDNRVEIVTRIVPPAPPPRAANSKAGPLSSVTGISPAPGAGPGAQAALEGEPMWAAYPASGAQTQQLLRELNLSEIGRAHV